MFKANLSLWLASAAAIGAIFWLPDSSMAAGEFGKSDSIALANEETQEQVTNVFELRDVSPNDWAFEALRSLVERYGCIEGYPDKTYRGRQALTRYEFAAGLNACMNQIERLIAASESVLREDIEKLQRLSEEFRSELEGLGARVDDLEGRVAFLEEHQFSTTTKLEGQSVVGLYGVAAGEKNGGEKIDTVPALGHRTRLELNTSFSGKDLLFTRLSGGNAADLVEVTETFEGGLAFSQPDDNDVGLEVLNYRFPIGENINLWLEAWGGSADDFTSTFNYLDGDGASGAVSLFGTRNPIYYQTGGQSGLGFQGQWGSIELSAGYLAQNANDPTDGNGLFNGPYTALGQIGYKPNEDFGVAFTYIRGYNRLDTGTGSNLSNFQSFSENLFGEAIPIESNSYGIEFSWEITDRFILSAWGAYIDANTFNVPGILSRSSLDIWNWAVTLAFLDFLKEGSQAGIIVGMEPWVADSDIDIPGIGRLVDRDTSIHVEALFEYPILENISITPAIIAITAPNYNSDNAALIIGTLRTTFSF